MNAVGKFSRYDKSAQPKRDACRSRVRLLLVAALVARLTKQLTVLLLRHTLTTLLDYGTHSTPYLPEPALQPAIGQYREV